MPYQPTPSQIGPLVEQFAAPSQIIEGAEALKPLGYDDAEARQLRDALGYVRTFLGKANPNLGRAGPVCPFINGAVQGDFLRLAVSRIASGDAQALARLAEHLLVAFRRMSDAGDERHRQLTSLIVIFPNLVTPEDFAAIEYAQAAAKLAFVDGGDMLGEFYPGNPQPGLHNPDFHPLAAPFASLAVRRMTISDAPFMLADARYRAAYVRRFGSEGERLIDEAAARGERGGQPVDAPISTLAA